MLRLVPPIALQLPASELRACSEPAVWLARM